MAAACSHPEQASTTTAPTGTLSAPATSSNAETSAKGTTPTSPSDQRSRARSTTTAPSAERTTSISPPATVGPSTVDPTAPAVLRPVGLAGVNDPDCTSDARPVVLLHGTFSTVASNFGALVPALQAAGRCVYGIDYGLGGTRPVTESARSVSTFIDTVLAVTGADQVDVIGFSQGGLVLRTALREDDLAGKVAVGVLSAPSFHGTTSPLLDALPAGACPACADQAADSSLLTELNAGGDLDGDVRYAVVSTADDTVVTPVASQVPNGPPDRVRSLLVQDRCPGKRVDHVVLPADAGVIGWTVAALETGGTPDPTALTCG